MPILLLRSLLSTAIAIALVEFNDLRRSVTPTFIFRNRFYLLLSSHCPKMDKISMWKVLKKSDFCPQDTNSCDLKAARRVKVWSLNASLFFKGPQQLTKFT